MKQEKPGKVSSAERSEHSSIGGKGKAIPTTKHILTTELQIRGRRTTQTSKAKKLIICLSGTARVTFNPESKMFIAFPVVTLKNLELSIYYGHHLQPFCWLVSCCTY